MESLQDILENTEVNETTPISVGHLVAVLVKPNGPFTGLKIYASNSKVRLRFAPGDTLNSFFTETT